MFSDTLLSFSRACTPYVGSMDEEDCQYGTDRDGMAVRLCMRACNTDACNAAPSAMTTRHHRLITTTGLLLLTLYMVQAIAVSFVTTGS